VVLLKNDGLLPLKAPKAIAVIGPNADDKSVLLGNYNGTPSRYTTILKGIQDAADARVYYARGCHIYDDGFYAWQEQPMREAIIAAQKSDVVIMCMGLNPSMEGEEGDAFNGTNSGDKRDIELPLSQLKLLEEIVKVGKPIVFLNISGSCVNLTKADETCNAVVQVFYPGAEGGNAVADILFGKVSPSGKLPVTFYRSTEDLPDFTQYSMADRTYKYFKGKPLYPFGHGLSYTKFTISQVSFTDHEATLSITNAGDYDASEVVKIFARDRKNNELNCRLAGFGKVFVKRGETVHFKIELCQEIMELFEDKSNVEFFIN
jgi:beta-glucosidase